MTVRRFSFWASFLTLAAFAILCALGTWQVVRLQEKTRILHDLDAAYATGALPVLSRDDLADFAAGAMAFARAGVAGRYDHDKEILIGPRPWQGQPGFHVVTPFMLDGGGALLINRGWVPLDKKDRATRSESINTGYMTVSGLLRRPEKINRFVPANDPQGGLWYSIDPPAVAGHFGVADMAPLVLYAETEMPSADMPVRAALQWRPPNNHLQYALFWFSMAGILLIIFGARFLKKAP